MAVEHHGELLSKSYIRFWEVGLPHLFVKA